MSTKIKIEQIINRYVGRVPVEILQELRNELSLAIDVDAKKKIKNLVMKTADFFDISGRKGLNEYFVRAKPKTSAKYIKQIFKERKAGNILQSYDLKTQTVQVQKSQLANFQKSMINVLPGGRVKLASILAYTGNPAFLGSLAKIKNFGISTPEGRKLQQDITRRAMRTKGTLEYRIAGDLRLRYKLGKAEAIKQGEKLTWRKFYKLHFGSGNVRNLASAVRIEISFLRKVLGKLEYIEKWAPFVTGTGEIEGTYKGESYANAFTGYTQKGERDEKEEHGDGFPTGGIDYRSGTPTSEENKNAIMKKLKARGWF